MCRQVVHTTIGNKTYYLDLDNGFKFFVHDITFSIKDKKYWVVMSNLRLKDSENELIYLSEPFVTIDEANDFLTDFLRRANYAFR